MERYQAQSPPNGGRTFQQGQPPEPKRKLPAIEVFGFEPPEKPGNLLCFFSVRVGKEPTALTLHQCRLVRQGTQSPWFSPPQASWLDADGARRYKTLVDLPRDWREAILSAALAAWQDREREGGAS